VAVIASAFARKTFESHRNLITTVSNLWNAVNVSGYDYGNDSLARRVRRVDNGAVTNDFGYNGRSELTAADMGTNRYGYVYDPIGNRLVATNNAEVLTYMANALNQYTNIADGVVFTHRTDPPISCCIGMGSESGDSPRSRDVPRLFADADHTDAVRCTRIVTA
jgi:hypothetical protein